MPTKKKTSSPKKSSTTAARKKAAPTTIDKRWAILLFGLGLFFVLFSVIPGESGWAFMRINVLFGVFGISGWLLGPALIWWAVLVSLEKPFVGAIVKGAIFLFVLSGAALVFGPLSLEELTFGEIMAALHQSGSGGFGGGVISLVFGASLLLLCGPLAARVLLTLLVLLAIMVLAGKTPGDVAHFFANIGGKVATKLHRAEEVYDQLEMQEGPMGEPAAEPEPAQQARPSARRAVMVDIPLQPQEAAALRRPAAVDIDLGPDTPTIQPGKGYTEPIDIGPGGTFGQKALQADEELGLGDYTPLVPFAGQRSAAPQPQEQKAATEILMFGEDDPYVNLGGAQTKLPRGGMFDVEYIPKQDPNFNLFDAPLPQPVQSAMQTEPQAVQPATAQELPAQPAEPTAAPDALPQATAQEVAPATSEASAGVDALIEKAAATKVAAAAADTRTEQPVVAPYSYPPATLFDAAPAQQAEGAREEMKKTADLLVSTLSSFGVETRILDVSRGPSVTRYEIQPQAGVKISRITNLSDDIALNLSAAGVRIEAPIPGKPAVGIEVPNNVKSTVSMRSLLESSAFVSSPSPLSIALGKDIAGDVVVADLTKMPHLLIAGSTGSGKSVCVNSIIMSFVYKNSPEDVRMILIDPKVVELAEYNGIPHLLIPVVTEPKQAAKALGQAVLEMERRYHSFAEYGVRDITSFNNLAQHDDELEKIPHIAIVIDELADLMMTAGKDVENYICRIAQKARAAGMHLIVATQRPSVDVITGLIKSNIPSRIAFAVSSQVDSRTILDGAGAEKLLGMGDMLFMPIGANKPVRVQGTYVKDKEISGVIQFVKQNAQPLYDDNFLAQMDKVTLSGAAAAGDSGGEADAADLLNDAVFISAVETALENGQISTSFLQRRLRLGYARAGRIVDQMEQMGIISEPEGSKPRQVLITRMQWQEMSINASE